MNQADTPKDPHLDDAVKVSDHCLEVTRKAYFDRDFSVFQERFIIPQIVETFAGEKTIEIVEELRTIFDNVCAFLDNRGILDMNRRTLSAKFLSSERIEATFISQYLFPSLCLSDEVYAHGTLRLVDGLWRIEESRYTTGSEDITRALSLKSLDERFQSGSHLDHGCRLT